MGRSQNPTRRSNGHPRPSRGRRPRLVRIRITRVRLLRSLLSPQSPTQPLPNRQTSPVGPAPLDLSPNGLELCRVGTVWGDLPSSGHMSGRRLPLRFSKADEMDPHFP
jgi:hypothetical protein